MHKLVSSSSIYRKSINPALCATRLYVGFALIATYVMLRTWSHGWHTTDQQRFVIILLHSCQRFWKE